MSKFTHDHYDGKHWIKGTTEYALDNELNRLNKQIMKFAKANAMNSPSYKHLVTEIAVLSHNQIKHVNGVPQAKRGAKEIAKAATLNGDKQFRKIAKSKSHKTFGRYKTEAKKLGLTPNELSYISNESAVYYQTMYSGGNDDAPIEMYDDSDLDLKITPQNNYEFHNNPHNFDNNVCEILAEDIIIPVENGNVNVETGEYFDNYEDALRSFDETANKISAGKWEYYNQFKHKKEW